MIDATLHQLVDLAGTLHDELAAGEWEAAVAGQEEYDAAFARFLAQADQGEQVSRELHPLLTSLQAMHDENLGLARELQASARAHLSSVSATRKVGKAYSPLGANHRPTPRFIDGAA